MCPWRVIPDSNRYFVTTSIVRWQPVLRARVRCHLIIQSLKHCLAHKGLHLHGFVIMPTHAHYILSCDPGRLLSDIMRDFNTHTSREISASLQADGEFRLLRIFREAAEMERRGNSYKVWQTGFHPVSIETDRFFRQKLHYVHENPVRAGLVELAEEWEYSSARNYAYGDHTIIQVEFIDWIDRI